ncbi:hypothetical protein ACKWTF_012498 [Chironomus riparius]
MDRFKHDNDESVEEEIIEDISKLEDLSDSDFDDSDDIPIFLNDSKDDQHEHHRVIHENDDLKLFDDNVDEILALDNIAKHFTSADDDDGRDSDTIVPIKVSTSNKELSPSTEDTIFINDKKVSISSLKKFNDVNASPQQIEQLSQNRESVGVTAQSTSIDKASIKRMEKISSDFLNDILDDITEESETESREKEPIKAIPPIMLQDKIEKGSLVRNILKSNLFDDQSEAQDTVIDRGAESNDFNEQLDSQEIFKENQTALNSIATTSTEYKTMNDYLNSKIYDVDSEFYDRATYIKSLQNQLQESSQERAKLTNEIEMLKTKLASEESLKSLNSGRIEIFSKRVDDFKKSLSSEILNAPNFDHLWPKLESFIEGEVNLLKNTHQEEMSRFEENIAKERKETELEINKLRQLLSSVKSDSSCIEDLKRELEIKHADDMKELREYFEKRCQDLGKEYTEEVLSMNESIHSRKIESTNQDVDDILTDDYASHQSAKESQLDNIPNDFNAYNELQKIKADYERSLKEQVILAREDVLHEIEKNIQSLLSENFRDELNWPPELILLREKLTAANQLEIAQLKIKHEEEMARIKSDSDIEVQRRMKRQNNFDQHRDLGKILNERDNFRELSSSLRFTLCELAKCFNQYDEDLNITINSTKDELNISTVSSSTKKFLTYKPDISTLLSIVEDPKLLDFISPEQQNEGSVQINIMDCLNRLKTEANNILELSEQIQERQQKSFACIEKVDDNKADSCEEEDGLRCHYQSLEMCHKNDNTGENVYKEAQSLPIFLDGMNNGYGPRKVIENGVKKFDSPLIQKEEYTEGFGTISPIQRHHNSLKSVHNKAKELLAEPTNFDNAVVLYQLIEDFCRETDYFIESEKKLREDLQKQLEVADKQLKSNKKFLDEQAAERDAERDEFTKEVEKLRISLKEKDNKDKDKSAIQNFEKKIASCEEQIKELTEQVESLSVLKNKSEEDLKASIEKVFDLREIISDLESQIQTKTLNENVLVDKCEKLEKIIDLQDEKNESNLDKENEYIERIKSLENQLKILKPSNEQKLVDEQMTSHLKTIEMLMDRKTKTLEAFHAFSSAASNTACSSPSEDVSKSFDIDGSDRSPKKLWKTQSDGISLPFEEVQRILEKVSKHNRMEEATIKKVTDLEMTINEMKKDFEELQQEKDILQDRMSEQLIKISSLQSRLDEQRIRAEELNKQNTSDLTLRVHDLHNELSNLKEILFARDKQISNLNQLLENSKSIIEKQDQQLAQGSDSDKSFYEKLNNELKHKDNEIETLKNKIKSEMINKAMIPDLMETMIAEKNEEIDNLKEQISLMTSSLMQKQSSQINNSKFTGSSFLTMISEYDEPDILRKAVQQPTQINFTEHKMDELKAGNSDSTMSSTNEILTDKATMNTLQEQSQIHMPSHIIPRKIEFSSLEDFSAEHDKTQNGLKNANEEIHKLKTTIDEQNKQINEFKLELESKIKLYEDIKMEKKAIDEEIEKLQSSVIQSNALENELKKKEGELTNFMLKNQDLELNLKSQAQDLESLRDLLNGKEELINQLSEDLVVMKNKCRDNERVLVDLDNLKKQVSSYDDVMVEKETMLKKLELDLLSYVKNEQQLLSKAEQCDKLLGTNRQLEDNIESLRHELCVKTFSLEKCKIDLHEMENEVESLKKESNNGIDENIDRYSIAEIASKLDDELNYAAELDGKIIKAIESESDINSEIEELGGRDNNRIGDKIKKLKMELEEQKVKYLALSNELDDEKRHFSDIHSQDAKLIESMNMRLKAALENESILKRLLETEKNKLISLSSHLSGVQRTKSFDSNLIFNKAQRMHDLELESEMIQRQKSEIKMLTSQNDVEKDRVMDLQSVVDRERERFKKTLSDQQSYIDQLKREVHKHLNDNQMLRTEINKVRERNYMRGNNEFDEMDGYNNMLDDSAPIAETLKRLLTERHELQQKVLEYERSTNLVQNYHDMRDLEEQNNYLIARFMRSESFRKALVFQKKFLLITLATTIGSPPHSLYKADTKKRKTFRSIALLIIAIERFKFIAKRWTGKRVIAKALYASPPKRSQSASNNNWTVLRTINFSSNTQPKNYLPSPTTTQQPKQSQLTRLQNLFHDTQQ